MSKISSNKNILLKTGALMFAALYAGAAKSDHNLYTLPWAAKGETLTYSSCGCADSCWVAELRERKSKRLKARLRSDCYSLYVIYPASETERKLAESGSVINDSPDKFSLIPKEMKRIVEDERAK